MGASEKRKSGQDADGATFGGDSYGSLTRTLQDLEARLSRIAGEVASAAPATPAAGVSERGGKEADEATEASTSARLRRIIEQRLADSSRLAIDTGGAPGRPSPRHGARAQGLDKRLGTIAGEVESLKMQGATLQLVASVADELKALKGEIADKVAATSQSGFDEIRHSFDELRGAIAARDETSAVNAQIAALLERLSDMQASGSGHKALEMLRGELGTLSHALSRVASEEGVAAVGHRWDAFEAKLEAHIELDGAAKRDLRAELERLRETVRSLATEDQVRAVETRWDEFEAHCFDRLRTEAENHLGRFMRGELEDLRERLEGLAAINSGTELADRLDRLEHHRFEADRQFAEALARLVARFGELEEALLSLPDLFGVQRLEERLHELSESVALVAERQAEPDLEHFLILEERLDEISEAIVSSALCESAPFDMAPIERIEARIADLSARLERVSELSDPDGLSERLAELSSRIEHLATAPMAAVDERLEAFGERFEAALRQIERPEGDIAGFEIRLNSLAERLEQASGAALGEELVRSLEGQIAHLSAQLAQSAPVAPAAGEEETQRQLAAIERRLDDNRAEIMAAAKAAAEEAVRLVNEGGPQRDGEHLRDLTADLSALESLCRQNDERSLKLFEAVHSTLLKVADRLASIEGEMRRTEGGEDHRPSVHAVPQPAAVFPQFEAAPAATVSDRDGEEAEPRGLRAAIARHLGVRRGGARSAAQALADAVSGRSAAKTEVERTSLDDAPPLDAAESILDQEANRPLEPGSGAPDIASLLERVRGERRAEDGPVAKADFIAAARKAALAAAAEADSLRLEASEAGGPDRQTPSQNGAGRYRKPILMGVGAILVAMMAIPLGRSFVGTQTQDGIETASITPAVEAATEEPAPVLEPDVARFAPEIVPVIAPEPTPPAEAPSRTVRTFGASVSQEESIAALAATRAAGGDRGEIAGVEAPAAEASPQVAAESQIPAQDVAGLADDVAAELPRPPAGIGPTALVAAADANDPKAIFEIGLRLLEGRAGESRPDEALLWFTRAGELGYAPAQYSLGTLFEKGNGVERDTGAARDWYRLAADEGNVRAMHNLAVLYATGIEGSSEPETAAHWFTEAAEHGMRDSQYNLGILHARGVGVEQDLGRSYKWFSIVGASGDRDAVSKRDEVAKTLSAEEIAAIDAEVAAWTPRQRVEAANSVDIPTAWTEAPEQTASIDRTRAIRNVQSILINLGFDPGTPDGIVGERTTNAVRAFQEANGLAPTGDIDEALIRELLSRNS